MCLLGHAHATHFDIIQGAAQTMTVNPGAIMAGFRLLGWLFPAPPLEELTSESFESLRQKYKSRDRWGNFLGLLAFIAVAAIYYLFLSWLAQAATRRFADAKFLHHPMELEYILMGLFLSLASTGFFGCLALRAFLGREEYAIYMAYGALLRTTANPCGKGVPMVLPGVVSGLGGPVRAACHHVHGIHGEGRL